MRAVAAFWVIYTHSGTISSIVPDSVSSEVGRLFAFRVPFFLLASFYFLAASLLKDRDSSLRVWWKRSQRLAWVFLPWTWVYAGLHVAHAVLRRQDPAQAFADPVGLLLGGGAVHLYFLPLLLCGQLALWAGLNLCGRLRGRGGRGGLSGARSVAGMLLLLAVLMAAKNWVGATGNGFSLVSMRAFTALFPEPPGGAMGRVLLVGVAHAITCGPLIVTALLLARFLPRAAAGRARPALLAAAGAGLCALRWCPAPVYTEAAALCAFVFALLLPLPGSAWTRRAGRLSAGIYLAHQVPLEALDLLLGRAGVRIEGAASTWAMLACSALCFGACWVALAFIDSRIQMLRPAVGAALSSGSLQARVAVRRRSQRRPAPQGIAHARATRTRVGIP